MSSVGIDRVRNCLEEIFPDILKYGDLNQDVRLGLKAIRLRQLAPQGQDIEKSFNLARIASETTPHAFGVRQDMSQLLRHFVDALKQCRVFGWPAH